MMTNHVALPTLSAERRLLALQQELRVPGALVATLAGIAPAKLSDAYRGVKTLDNDLAAELISTLRYLVEIRDALAPFALNLTNASEVRDLVDTLKSANVTPERVREAVGSLLDNKGLA